MRAIAIVLLVLLTPATGLAQGRGPDPDRRAELEQRVRQQFLRHVADRLDLTAEQRTRVREVLAEGAEARRDLALESQALRIDLIQAVRDDEAEMARFEAILERLEAIRAREREIAQQEEAALAEVLDPRQRAVFLLLRMEMNDRVRQLRRHGPGGMGGGSGGPAGGMPGGVVPFI